VPRFGHITDVALNRIDSRLRRIEEELNKPGTIQHFSKTATSDVKVPATGKRLQILSFFYYCDADIITELRFKTTGNVIAGLPGKGAVGMNLLGRARPEGETNEAVEIYLSAAGNVKGWICFSEV